jgi:HEAT repeat protein
VFELPSLPRNLESSRRDLKDVDARIRIKVVSDLSRVRDPEEREARVGLLVGCLSDKNVEVRRQALLGLADLQAKEATLDVLNLLSDVELRVRQFAVLCLGEISNRSDLLVHQRLRSLTIAPEARLRYQAISALGQLDPDGFPSVADQGLRDLDPEIRELSLRLLEEVIVAAGRQLSPELSDMILQACSEPDAGIRLIAQIVAGELGWDAPRDMLLATVRRRFKVREPRDEQEAIALCGRLGLREALPSLSRRGFGWFGISFDPFRWVALGALAQLGDTQAVAKLEHALRSRRFSDRTMAVKTLGEVGDPRALPLLRELNGSTVDQEVLDEALRRLS